MRRYPSALPLLVACILSRALVSSDESCADGESPLTKEDESPAAQQASSAVDGCADKHELCAAWAAQGECAANPAFMKTGCAASCLTCAADAELAARRADPAAIACDDEHDACTQWAEQGECENNKAFMILECSRSCATCLMRDPKVRCKRDESVRPAISGAAGDSINALFERATSDAWAAYSPTVHSRDPWVVTYEDFISAEEADGLLEAFAGLQLERSSNVGGMDEKGRFRKSLDTSRTSENAWCMGACAQRDTVRRVQWRIGNLTGVSEAQSEFLQMLHYDPGQYYRSHHDFIPQHLQFPIGPRLLTLFLYLSDVDGGGETTFNSLNITVTPKKGRALLWPSVTDGALTTPDMRTMHEAKPVLQGEKYAANAWLHLYDFRTPHSHGCVP